MSVKQRTVLRWILIVFGLGIGTIALLRGKAFSEETISADKLYRSYVQAIQLVRDNYDQPINYEALNTAAVSGMLRSLDPHSNYFDRKSFDEMRMEQRSQYYGIGASIQQRFGGVYVIEPFRNTPAVRAGLRYGDRIVLIDGENASEWNSDQVRDHLRGELGTKVVVTIERVGEKEPLTLKLERAAVDLPSISASYVLQPGIGYVALSRGFHSTTFEELNRSVLILKSAGMHSLILDLRGNPGGFLDQAIRVSDKFLQRGQKIVSVRGRSAGAGAKDWEAESGTPETFPMVVLIDDGSASASEIVAGAIQDNDRGLIIGEPSFGKGLVQTIFPLNGGVGLTLTTARYYTPSGRLIQRDYSNGSTYEYLSRRGQESDTPPTAARTAATLFKTGLGRPVYGGGGIDPDIIVKPSEITRQQGLILGTGLFLFVRDLLAGRVASAPEFRRGEIEFDHLPKTNEFVINDQIMEAYRGFMANFIRQNGELGLTAAQVSENMTWAHKRIREEVLIAAYGVDTQRRIMAADDLQLQRAVAEIPQSSQMAERARRGR